MTVGNYSFRPAPLLTLLVACIVATTAGLGFWQLDRAEQKQHMQAAYAQQNHRPPLLLSAQSVSDEPLVAHRLVEASGQYESERFLLWDNQTHRGVAGYHVLSLLRLPGERSILVDRGWVPPGASRAVLPKVTTPTEAVLVKGLLFKPSMSPLAREGMTGEGWPKVVQSVEPVKLESLFATPLYPYVIRLDPTAEHGFIRDPEAERWLQPATHTAYAVQWFLLALAAVAVYVGLSIQRKPMAGGDT